MNLMNLGREQLEGGGLNDMLRQVGISDVNSFVNQFRNQVNQESSQTEKTSGQQPDLVSMGSSLLNQFGGGSGKKQAASSGSGDLIGGAMSAYKMFSGGKGASGSEQTQGTTGGNPMDMFNSAMKVYKSVTGGGAKEGSATGGGGGLFDNIGSTVQNAQQMQSLLKKLDRNGDGKITVDDIQLILQSLGLGSVSPQISKALFKAVDRNQNGQLDLTDVMALAAIVSKIQSRFGSGGNTQTQPIPQH